MYVIKGETVRHSALFCYRRRRSAGNSKVSYIETIYPPACIAEHDINLCKYYLYEKIVGGVLCRDLADHRSYEETM